VCLRCGVMCSVGVGVGVWGCGNYRVGQSEGLDDGGFHMRGDGTKLK
jgi:hypothetical protein